MALAFGINLSGFKDTLKSYKSQLKAVKEIPNLGRVISFTRDMAKGKSLLESLDGKEDTINAISTMYNGPSTGTVSAGLNYGQMNSKGTLYNNTQIQAGNKLIVKADNMTVRGEGKYVDVDVKNLLIESLQDNEEMKQVGTVMV